MKLRNFYGYFYSFCSTLKNKGPIVTFQIFIMHCIDYCFDLTHGTDTMSWVSLKDLKINSDNKSRGVNYQPSRIVPLKMLLKKLNIHQGNTLVDIGCGKGRVLLIGADLGFKECRGIEFAEHLCEIAKKNIKCFSKNNNAKIKIINIDAVKYIFKKDESVFFMFHPFDSKVMDIIMNNINKSIKEYNRDIYIIYSNPVYQDVIEIKGFAKYKKDFSFWGHNYVVYSNVGI